MATFFTVLNMFNYQNAVIQQQEEIAGSDIYIVLAVTLIIWLGLFGYLMFLDRKVNNLKEKIGVE